MFRFLSLINGHTWHKAPAGTTDKDRCGMFNKYCAANAPPAAGYYSYDRAALGAMSDEGKRLIPVCFEKPITTTRLLIEDTSSDQSRFLALRDEATCALGLPGGEGWEEDDGVGWDVGARIGSLQVLTQQQLGIDVPWMSYIEDIEQEDGVCRVYGYTPEEPLVESIGKCVQLETWLTAGELQTEVGEDGDLYRSAITWKSDDVIRGKGKAVSQRQQQYA